MSALFPICLSYSPLCLVPFLFLLFLTLAVPVLTKGIPETVESVCCFLPEHCSLSTCMFNLLLHLILSHCPGCELFLYTITWIGGEKTTPWMLMKNIQMLLMLQQHSKAFTVINVQSNWGLRKHTLFLPWISRLRWWQKLRNMAFLRPHVKWVWSLTSFCPSKSLR